MVKHKTFISYHHKNDQAEKNEIIDKLGGEDFIDTSVLDGDIDKDLSEESIMRKIREDYLRDSTVTLVIIGEETAQRAFINSEIQASLWGKNPHGILGVVTNDLYDRIYEDAKCSGDNCNCRVRTPRNHKYYLPELVYKNKDINRNKDLTASLCHYNDTQVYCGLVKYSNFIENADKYIEEAFNKRNDLNYEIAKRLSEDTPKIQRNSLSSLTGSFFK